MSARTALNKNCFDIQKSRKNQHYPKVFVTSVGSILNSATGTPLNAADGAYIAAGYTTDEVPTYKIRRNKASSVGLLTFILHILNQFHFKSTENTIS